MRQAAVGTGSVGTPIRSAAPASAEAHFELPKFSELYWKHGTTERSPGGIHRATFSNSMFATVDTDNSFLHYGTDPLSGFHLATGYMSLSLNLPLRPSFRDKSICCKPVEAARTEFKAWASSFRKLASHNLTLRFVVGDALAFCHTL